MEPLTTTVDLGDRTFTLQYDPESEVQKGMWEDLESGALYEPGTWQTIKAILREGDTFVDVGAHVGTFSCLAAALVGEIGSVVAFEPDKKNRKALITNVGRNSFDTVFISQKAVADITGHIAFHHCADNDGGHAIYDPGMQAGNPKSRQVVKRKLVECVTLDQCGFGAIRLVKIDVEGAECSVLRGAQYMISHRRPAIIAENNYAGLRCMGTDENNLRELIRQHGYREYGIQDSAPWLVPLTPDTTCRPTKEVDGKTCLVVYNLLFVPEEWPEIIYPWIYP